LFAAGEVDCATNSLDYYRILGLPIQASALNSCSRLTVIGLCNCRDESILETAIMARKQLLEAATGFYLIQNNALATMPAILPTYERGDANNLAEPTAEDGRGKSQNPLIQLSL